MEQKTVEMMEQLMQKNLERLDSDPNDEVRKKAMGELESVTDRLIQIEKNNMEYDIQLRKVDADQIRNAESAEIERKKQSLDWKRILFEMSKIMAPLVLNWYCQTMYQRENRQETLKFEENHILTSNYARKDLFSGIKFKF